MALFVEAFQGKYDHKFPAAMIGPEIPAHLRAPQRNKDLEEEQESVSNSIGPQIHSHLLRRRSTTPADEDDDDAAGPMPDTSSTKCMTKGTSSKISHSPGPSTARRPIGPTLPTQLSYRNPTFDDDDDDDEIGPRPPPSGARREEEDAVKRFMEVEESRRKKIEVLYLNIQNSKKSLMTAFSRKLPNPRLSNEKNGC